MFRTWVNALVNNSRVRFYTSGLNRRYAVEYDEEIMYERNHRKPRSS